MVIKAGMFANAVTIAHRAISGVVRPGDTVIDATCGRGKDTLFLAQLAGPQGRVYAFDIQEEAVADTRELLIKHDCLERVSLIKDNHRNLTAYVEGNAAAVMFNLGYLPGGDHSVKTVPEDTCRALDACLELLLPGGLVSLVFYPGHPGGQEELEYIEKYLSGLSQQRFEVVKTVFLNQVNHPPQIICVNKLGGGRL